MVVCHEKKIFGNCTSLIKPKGLGNVKGNLMDSHLLYLVIVFGWKGSLGNRMLSWVRHSEQQPSVALDKWGLFKKLYFLRHSLPHWPQHYGHKVSPSISAGKWPRMVMQKVRLVLDMLLLFLNSRRHYGPYSMLLRSRIFGFKTLVAVPEVKHRFPASQVSTVACWPPTQGAAET